MKDCEKDLLLIAARPQSVRKARIVCTSMAEGEQASYAALEDLFLWMASEELTLLRALLRLRNTVRFQKKDGRSIIP